VGVGVSSRGVGVGVSGTGVGVGVSGSGVGVGVSGTGVGVGVSGGGVMITVGMALGLKVGNRLTDGEGDGTDRQVSVGGNGAPHERP
jgi:hypothetical protein